jgi:hypothetical protein
VVVMVASKSWSQLQQQQQQVVLVLVLVVRTSLAPRCAPAAAPLSSVW